MTVRHLLGSAPGKAEAFQGRRELLDRIRSALSASPPEPVIVSQVLSGDGGVGKSQLAAALWREARDSDEYYRMIMWVNATSRDSVLSAYALAYNDLQEGSTQGAPLPEVKARRFLNWLENLDEPWLMVLDDIYDPGSLTDLWPNGRSHGRLLITTRLRDAAMTARGKRVDVGLFSPEESHAYLRDKIAGQADCFDGQLDGVQGVCSDLGNLPLALAQASAYIINEGISCREYAIRFQDWRESFSGIWNESGDSYTSPLPTAWSMATEKADLRSPVGMTRRVLNLIAVLDSDGIPENVVTSAAARRYFADGGSELSATLVRSAIRNAHNYSLVTHAPHDSRYASTGLVQVHALAQRSTLLSLPDEEVTRAIIAGADAVLEVWPDVPSDPAMEFALRRNAERLDSHDDHSLWDPMVHPVLFRAARSRGEVGQIKQAVTYLESLILHAERRSEADRPSTLSLRYRHTAWVGESGQLANAARSASKLLGDRLRVLPPSHPDVFASRRQEAHWLARVAAARNVTLAAVIEDRSRILGTLRSEDLRLRYLRARWRGRSGDATKAEAALRDLLADMSTSLPLDHPQVLGTRRLHAWWLGESGEVDMAVAAFTDLLRDELTMMDKWRPDVFWTRYELARWQGRAGKVEAAANLFLELIRDSTSRLGADHPTTLSARHELAYWRGEFGDAIGAAEAFRGVVRDRSRILDPDHPDTLASQGQLSSWLAEANDPGAAVTVLDRFLPAMIDVMGPQDSDTLTGRHHRARFIGEQGDAPLAVELLSRLIPEMEYHLGVESADTLIAQDSLHYWQAQSGDIDGATITAEALVNVLQRQLGGQHRIVVNARRELDGYCHYPRST